MKPLYQQDLACTHAACVWRASEGRGVGPSTAALVEAGLEVTGMDSSAELASIVRAAVPGAHFAIASVYEEAGEPLTCHATGVDADGRLRDFLQRAADFLPAGEQGLSPRRRAFFCVRTGGPPRG